MLAHEQLYQKVLWIIMMTAGAAFIGALVAFGDILFNLYISILLAAFCLSVLLAVLFKHPKIVILLVLFALSIRVFMMVLLKMYSFHVGLDGFYPGDVDAYAYHGDALSAVYSHSWLQALEGNLSYTVFVAFLYNHFGPDMNIPELINLGASILMIPLIYELGNRIGGQKVGTTAALLWSVFPSAIFWSISLLKDTLLALGMLLCAFLLLGISGEKLNRNDVCLGIMGIFLVSLMRPQYLLSVSLAIFIMMVFQFFKGNRHFLRNTLLILLAVSIIGTTTAGDIITEEIDDSTTEEGVNRLNEIALDGGSGIEVVTRFPSEIRWLVQLPFSIFAPFPWQWLSVSEGIYLISGLEMIVWYIIYYSIWKNRKIVLKGHSGKILLLYAFSIFIAVSFSLPNIGSIYRYRFAALILLLPLTLFRPSEKRDEKRNEA